MVIIRKDKSAAVELSLNLIIMLIIGMVVLGLVIGFVNGLVNKGTESFDKQLGDNEKLKLDDVKTCPDNLCINPSPSLSLKKGSKTNIFIKVRAFGDEIDCNAGELNSCGDTMITYEVLDEDGNPDTESLLVTGPGFKAKNGGEDAQMYTLKTTDSTNIGTYYLTFKLYKGTDNEETKTITVQVS